MQLLRSARWMVLAFLISLAIPATSHAGVFISVAIAPPPLLVYDQPPCPEPGWIWTPGYWAYDYDSGGYYWVPGTWIPAPYVGALWTPGFWGWQEGVYIWHVGYWGRHVGYYGGVNYGFGYFGIGFVGGEWRGSRFAYNTAVWHVNRDRVRDVYEDRRGWDRYTVRNDRHVAYVGGPNGIRHDPTPDERNFMHEDHMQPTSFQQQHMEAAAHDRSAFFNNNHGRPGTVVADRPMTPRGGDMRPNGMNGGRQNGQPDNRNGGMNPQDNNRNNRNDNRGNDNRNMDRPNNDRQNNQGQQYAPGTSGTRPNYGNSGAQGQPQNQPNTGTRPQNNNRGPESNMRNRAPERQAPQQIHPQPAPAPQPQVRPEPQPQPRQAPPQQMRQQPEIQRPMPQARPQPEARPAPQQRPQESKPAPQQRNDRGNGHGNEHERDK
jgi:hypothetical protein